MTKINSARSPGPALKFIFVTLFLQSMGFTLVMPILPRLLVSLQAGSLSEGSFAYGMLLSGFSLMQFVCSPVLGSLSDAIGRRKVILLCQAGATVDYLLMAMAPNLAWFFLARLIAGATAGTIATCRAYIADITLPADRARAFGIIGASFGIGSIMGPTIGGLIAEYGERLPFYFSALIVAVNVAYGYYVLPESLAEGKRRPFRWRGAHPIGPFLALDKKSGLGRMLCVLFLSTSAAFLNQSTWVLAITYKFGWNSALIGISLACTGVASTIVQFFLVRPIVRRLGETRSLIYGLLLNGCCMIGYGLVKDVWVFYCIVPLAALAAVSGPAAQAIMSRMAEGQGQGALQGSIASLSSLAAIVSPLVATWAFGYFTNRYHNGLAYGVTFFQASLMLFTAATIVMVFVARERDSTRLGA